MNVRSPMFKELVDNVNNAIESKMTKDGFITMSDIDKILYGADMPEKYLHGVIGLDKNMDKEK